MSAFTDAVDRGLEGMDAVSSGTCPGCERCMEIDGYTDEQNHRDDWHNTDMPSGEGGFSWRPCGVCGTSLGGDRNTWHWIDVTELATLRAWRDAGEIGPEPDCTIHHESDMCDDCAIYLANGDEPEGWRKS